MFHISFFHLTHLSAKVFSSEGNREAAWSPLVASLGTCDRFDAREELSVDALLNSLRWRRREDDSRVILPFQAHLKASWAFYWGIFPPSQETWSAMLAFSAQSPPSVKFVCHLVQTSCMQQCWTMLNSFHCGLLLVLWSRGSLELVMLPSITISAIWERSMHLVFCLLYKYVWLRSSMTKREFCVRFGIWKMGRFINWFDRFLEKNSTWEWPSENTYIGSVHRNTTNISPIQSPQ